MSRPTLRLFDGYDHTSPHLRRAVREGASVLEIIEALETAALPGGFPVLHYALPFVAAIEKDLKEGRLR